MSDDAQTALIERLGHLNTRSIDCVLNGEYTDRGAGGQAAEIRRTVETICGVKAWHDLWIKAEQALKAHPKDGKYFQHGIVSSVTTYYRQRT